MNAPHLKVRREDIGKYVLLPGDPARVYIATEFLEDWKEVGRNREFVTVTGYYKGIKISVISTGIGGPSAAIAVEEASNLGAEVFIRIGTCGCLKPEIKPGDLIIPYAATVPRTIREEYLPKLRNLEVPAAADPFVFVSLVEAAKKVGRRFWTGINRTHDAFYESTEYFLELKNTPFISSEMETGVIFFVSWLRGKKAGAIQVVNTYEPPELVENNPDAVYVLEDQEEIYRAVKDMIKVALEGIVIYEEKYSKIL